MIKKYVIPCMVVVMVGFMCIDVFLLFQTPRHDRLWEDGQERLAYMNKVGDVVIVENYRDFIWHDKEHVTKIYQQEKFDLSTIRGVDVIVSHFASFEGMAHIFLSFRFADGKNMIISVESRREVGESFSPWRGLFRQYEMIYVVGTERDLIGMRTHIRDEDVYIYPTVATQEQAKDLLMLLMEDINDVSREPQFYHTIFNNCTNAITRRVMHVADVRFPWSYRMLLPGLVDGVLYEKGIIPHDQPFAQVKEQYRIDPGVTVIDDPLFSQLIRKNSELNKP